MSLRNIVVEAQSVYRLRMIDHLLKDPLVNEIMVNRPGQVYYEKNGKMTPIAVPELNDERLDHFFAIVARENRTDLDATMPLLSGTISDSSRIQIVNKYAAKHNTFSIRRKVARDLSLDDYVKSGFYNHMIPSSKYEPTLDELPKEDQHLIDLYADFNWDEFMRYAVIYKKNVMISGATSTGKTTYFKALSKMIPEDERLITCEDTYELDLPHDNQVNLLAPSNKDQGETKIEMRDLVKACLRLRPDRILMGELRSKEVLDYLTACSTGHEGSICTIHANSANDCRYRMAGMYRQNNVMMGHDEILEEIDRVVDVIIHIVVRPNGRFGHSIHYRYQDQALERREEKRAS